jgi:hypothetical protein
VTRLEEKCGELESVIQKNEFANRAKYESDQDQYSSIIAQYDKKLEDLGATNERIKRDREKELEKAKNFYESNLTKVQSQMREL